MPNWQKHKPVSGMSVEEMKRRVKDGLARRRQTGELRKEGLGNIQTKADGPTLTKQQRRVLIQAAERAIYALTHNDALDYCHAAEAMNACRRQAGMPTKFMKDMLEGVAHSAAELSGESFQMLDQLARSWLEKHYTPSNRLISIATTPKGSS
jgi:hypothetical protein